MRVAAAILTVFAILAAAIGIDQSYGEYATIGSLFGEDSYSQADLTGLAKRKDLITVAQWRKQAANGTRAGNIGIYIAVFDDRAARVRCSLVIITAA